LFFFILVAGHCVGGVYMVGEPKFPLLIPIQSPPFPFVNAWAACSEPLSQRDRPFIALLRASMFFAMTALFSRPRSSLSPLELSGLARDGSYVMKKSQMFETALCPPSYLFREFVFFYFRFPFSPVPISVLVWHEHLCQRWYENCCTFTFRQPTDLYPQYTLAY